MRAVITGSLLACALAGSPPGARAQETLPPVTVTESRPAPDLSTVVAEEMAAAPSPALTGVLRLVPGVHVDRAGAAGGVSSLYLRGADPNFTAVLLDGVRINDPTNTRGGSLDFSTLTTDDIERVEVLRGPVSALYGADALAGAVNLVSTRGAGAPHYVGELGSGDQGARRAHLAARGQRERLDYALGAGWTDGGTATPGSAARLGSGSLNLGWAPGAATTLRTTLRYLDGDLEAFPEDSGGFRHATRRTLERRGVRQWTGGLEGHWLAPDGVSYRAALGGHRRGEDVVSPGVAPGIRDPFGIPASRSRSELERLDFDLSAAGEIGSTAVTSGVQVGREEGRSDAVLELLGPANFAQQRDHAAAYFGVDHPFSGGLRAELSARIEDPDAYEAAVTPRARLSWRLWRTLLSLSAGRGFKLPSFYALGHPIVGNPALRPEESEGYEVGAIQELAGATLSLALFQTRYRNAVDFEEGPPPRLVNRAGVRAAGGELGARWDFGPRGHLRAHLAYVDTQIENSTERLRNRPRWTGGAQLHYAPASPIDLVLGLVHVGANLDSSIPTGDRELPGFTRLDAGIGWVPAIGFGVRLDAENLADEDYDELVGFPGARRNFRLSFRMHL